MSTKSKRAVKREAASGYMPKIAPKTPNQEKFWELLKNNDIVFVYGKSGSGKTLCSTAFGLNMLMSNLCSQMVLTRPYITAERDIGFLPGSMEEKMAPLLAGLEQCLDKCVDPSTVKSLKAKKMIEIIPVGFLRSMTLDGVTIIDECQNASFTQLKMILTRIGSGGKMIFTGDIEQTDLPKRESGGFLKCIEKLKGIEGIAAIEFESCDILRHPLIGQILTALQDE